MATAPQGYRLSGFAEIARLVARAIDFVVLASTAAQLGALPRLGSLRRTILLELGPGPTKLRALKKLLFKRVHYIDSERYGKVSKDLTVMDLEELRSISSLSAIVPAADPSSVIVFADHCLEHLSQETIEHLLDLIWEAGVGCLIRVPNVLSDRGRRNYERDSTHKTPFDERYRHSLVTRGLSVRPYVRWYRRRWGRIGAGDASEMGAAEEIMIAGRGIRRCGD